MDSFVGLFAEFSIDAAEVGDRFATFKCFGQSDGIAGADGGERDAREVADRFVTVIQTAGNDDHFVSRVEETAGEISPDESGAAGDGDLHIVILS